MTDDRDIAKWLRILAGEDYPQVSGIDLEEAADEIERLRAELAAVTKDRDNWKAHAVSRGKRLRKTADKFCWIMKELEDEGDRVYFGSSNHADEFREAVAWLDDFKWDKVMGEPEDWDLLGALEKARAELAAERERANYKLACMRDEMMKADADLAAERERAERLRTLSDSWAVEAGNWEHKCVATLAALRQAKAALEYYEVYGGPAHVALAAIDAVLEEKE